MLPVAQQGDPERRRDDAEQHADPAPAPPGPPRAPVEEDARQVVPLPPPSKSSGPAPTPPYLEGVNLQDLLRFRDAYSKYVAEIEAANAAVGGRTIPKDLASCIKPVTLERIRRVHFPKINKPILNDQTLSETIDYLIEKERSVGDNVSEVT